MNYEAVSNTLPQHSSPDLAIRETLILPRVPDWRQRFKAPEQMKLTDTPMLIKGFLPLGITFVGGPAGHGKTYLSLSIAKALYFGTPLLDFFEVPKPTPVIYLSPEVVESKFKQRLDQMGLGKVRDGFLCQTLSDGLAIALDDRNLKAAIKDLKPVVFLDTTARFNNSDDENDAMAMAKGFAAKVFALLQTGARAVVPLHHSLKTLGSGDLEPTLENTLRGSGDLGAMADAAYCVICSDKKNFLSEITNVKARDFDPPDSFEIQGRPYLDETGDLKLVRPPRMEKLQFAETQAKAVGKYVAEFPKASQQDVASACRVRKQRVSMLASMAGFKQVKGRWQAVPPTGE
jgi:hypothetical protein